MAPRRVSTPPRRAMDRPLAFVVLLGLWWVMELGAVWGLYHEAGLYVSCPALCADAACGGPLGAAVHAQQVMRVRLGGFVCCRRASCSARWRFGGHAAAAHPGGVRHFRLPEVVAGLLVVNVALWFATHASARSSARRQPLPALSGASAQRFWGWGLGVGHLVPVLMVTQGLTQLAPSRSAWRRWGSACASVALQQQALAAASQAQTAAESMTDTMTSRRERGVEPRRRPYAPTRHALSLAPLTSRPSRRRGLVIEAINLRRASAEMVVYKSREKTLSIGAKGAAPRGAAGGLRCAGS